MTENSENSVTAKDTNTHTELMSKRKGNSPQNHLPKQDFLANAISLPMKARKGQIDNPMKIKPKICAHPEALSTVSDGNSSDCDSVVRSKIPITKSAIQIRKL